MEFAGALQAVVDGYRSRTDELLPIYFLSPAVGQITRMILLLGFGAAYGYLAATGRLARFRSDLRAADTAPPGAEAGVEAYERWLDAVLPAFDRLVTPEVVAILAGTVAVALLAYAVLTAVVTGAKLSACWATLHDTRATVAGLSGARRHWRPLFALLVLQVAVLVVVTAAAVAPIVLVAGESPLAALAVLLPIALVWLLVVAAARIVFAFAAVAVVVEAVGATAGLRAAFGFARANVLWVVGYLVAVLGVYTLIGSVAAAGGGSGAVSGLMGMVVVAPVLDLLRTALYGDHTAAIAPPTDHEHGIGRQVWRGLQRGLDELRAFVGARPGLHALAAVVLVAGGVAGWLLAGPYEGLVTASIQRRLESHSPGTAVTAFATNNIAVAVTTAFSGVGFGVPTVFSLLFNGAFLGALARLEAAPLVLAAFVLPHGVLELPAFVIAGALGFTLGVDAWRTRRGRRDLAHFADDLERAFWVLVGIAVLLAAAALIEGLFSPYYWRPFLGA